MGILNYTTTVAAEKTASEIVSKLAIKGARRVNQEYGEGGLLIGIGFTFEVAGYPVYFKLPANVSGVEKIMLKDAKAKHRPTYTNMPQGRIDAVKEQARKTAWRILKDWIEAQIALVESEQAEMAQVFLPYAQDDSGATMYELFVNNNQNRLAAEVNA